MGFAIPVAIIIFKRPEHTAKVFETIRNLQPEQLFVIADGPREGYSEDEALCRATRLVTEQIDWDCNVQRNYSQENMQLMYRISSGLTWVFEHVDRAIILEDDTVPHRDFYTFCEAMLRRYQGDDRIMSVVGNNHLLRWKEDQQSYCYVKFPRSAGAWATWRRAWRHFDFEVDGWRNGTDKDRIRNYIDDDLVYDAITRGITNTLEGRTSSWAWRWYYSILRLKCMGIAPARNLVSNIGYDGTGTHTFSTHHPIASLPIFPHPPPYIEPTEVVPDDEYMHLNQQFENRKRTVPLRGRLNKLSKKYIPYLVRKVFYKLQYEWNRLFNLRDQFRS